MQNTAITPLPKMKMVVICTVLISESAGYMFVFPFLPFMIRSFGVEESEVGFHSGWVASSFMFGQFLSSFAWGWISDKVGIRPVLIFGITVTIINTVCVGLSTSLAQVLTVRFFGGLLNGNIGVVKTYIGLITDQTNEATAFGSTALCWGIGSIFGPSIGGLLAQPVNNFPGVFKPGSVWDYYPYLLPCIVTAIIPFIGLVIGTIYLEEPSRDGNLGSRSGDKEMRHMPLEEEEEGGGNSPTKGNQHDGGHDMGDNPPSGHEDIRAEAEPGWKAEPLAGPGEDPVEGEVSNGCEADHTRSVKGEHGRVSPSTRADGTRDVVVTFAEDAGEKGKRAKTEHSLPKLESTWDFVKKKSVILPMLGYMMLRLVAVGLDDLIPLFLSTPRENGGMAFRTEGVGMAMLGQGVMLVAHVIFFFPMMQRRYGTLQLFAISAIASPFMFLSFPLLPYFQDSVPTWVLWVLVQLCLAVKVFAFSTGFTSVMMLVNNSAPRRIIGTINGVGQVLVQTLDKFYQHLTFPDTLNISTSPSAALARCDSENERCFDPGAATLC